MNELTPLEKRLQSWTPRRPSDKIARRLFGRGTSAALPNPVALWNWLAPVSVCLLAMIVAVHTAGGRFAASSDAQVDHGTFFATIMLDASRSSNRAVQTFALSKVDENLEWNIWPCVSLCSPTGMAAAALTNKID